MPIDNPLLNDYPTSITPALTRWVIPGWTFDGNAVGMIMINGRITYVPIFVSRLTTYIRVGVDVSTNAPGQTLDLRIFADDDGVPGALVEDFGNVSLNAVAIVEIVISTTLPRGFYWLAYRTTAGAGARIDGPNASLTVKCPVAGRVATPGAPAYPLLAVVAAWADPAPAATIMVDCPSAGVFLREV
jgi:hypothetical protein